ncbi:MAG: fibronectin type III domain-containing protein [Candidatus Roizmanbacteria bacterium]
MTYSSLFIGENNKKIPTLLGIFLIIFIALFFFGMINRSALPSKANKANIKRTEVTNLNPIQTTIYWQTDSKETGWVVYGEKKDQMIGIVLDDRDVSEKKGVYRNHYVTIRNLKPGNRYYYAVISRNQKIVKPDGSFFEFVTPKDSSAKTKIDPATGKVLETNINPLINAVVLLYVDENTAPLSTVTKDSGEWLIPLNSFYDKSSLEEKNFSGGERARIEIISEDSGISTIISKLKDLALNSETVIIGKNYNFIETNDVLSASTGFTNNNDTDANIIYPKEGSLIPGRKPLIKGISLPGAEIFITINSSRSYSAKITADKDGNWSYLIPEDLDLGKHLITIKTKNKQGKELIVSRSFTIVANEGPEGKVLGTASGEPTITSNLSPSPSVYVYPTATPTAAPPVSGFFSLSPIIGGLSLIILGGGILLAF